MLKTGADRERVGLIIVAAGRGTRAGGGLPKQYKPLAGSPVLQHTLDAFRGCDIHETIVVVADDDVAYKKLSADHARFVIGGSSREESVRSGMNALADTGVDKVLIHDGARPFVSHSLVRLLLAAVDVHDGAVPILPMVDAVKTLNGDLIGGSVDRSLICRVQTPQAFRFEPYHKAMESFEGDAVDDVEVAIAAGLTVTTVRGEESNIKLTYPEDFETARERMSVRRVGMGYDVHRIVDGDGVWVCGVYIECGFSLLGHSDADVGLHAITDAILGATASGDIGDHFPPSDPQWKGASSDRFLLHAVRLARADIVNVDVTIVCERPKIKPHREAMRLRVAELCGLDASAVSVKATTTEGLGFEGRQEGISAHAVVMVRT